MTVSAGTVGFVAFIVACWSLGLMSSGNLTHSYGGDLRHDLTLAGTVGAATALGIGIGLAMTRWRRGPRRPFETPGRPTIGG